MGKYWILLAGVSQGKWALLICLIISSAIGLYAYLRVIISLFQEQASGVQRQKSSCGFVEVMLGVLVLTTLMLGIMPNVVTDLIHAAVLTL